MTLKKVSVSVRSLFHQPMDEKIKTWPLCFPGKETLIWRRHCSIGQSCCTMTSKKFLESSSGMKFVYPCVRLANQNPGAFVSVSYTNQIALFPFVCCFCFVRAFSFQGHTKIALNLAELNLRQTVILRCTVCNLQRRLFTNETKILAKGVKVTYSKYTFSSRLY